MTEATLQACTSFVSGCSINFAVCFPLLIRFYHNFHIYRYDLLFSTHRNLYSISWKAKLLVLNSKLLLVCKTFYCSFKFESEPWWIEYFWFQVFSFLTLNILCQTFWFSKFVLKSHLLALWEFL